MRYPRRDQTMRRTRMFALSAVMSGVLFASAGAYAQDEPDDCATAVQAALELAEAGDLDAIALLALEFPQCVCVTAVQAAAELAEAGNLDPIGELVVSYPQCVPEIATAAAVPAAPPAAPEEPLAENPLQDVPSGS